jgi:DNA-binding CsgD family transcriptional regulator
LIQSSPVGRESELRTLDELVDGVRDRGAALVLRGGPGIGKSVLLHAARERAQGRAMLVLTTTGTQMEAHLPFAGLHQLLRPVVAGAHELPAPQRDALLGAFGMTEAPSPDLFLVALAALALLTDTAASAPVFLAVEDAQWLDWASAEVLAFVARRLESDPVVMVLALRDGCDSALDDAGLPELRLAGLDPDVAATLLDAHAPGLAAPLRDRILDEAEGNPLALVELPVAIAVAQRSHTELLSTGLPLTARLEKAFAARQSEFPAATRTVLLVGAANDGGMVADVLAAASIIDGEARSVDDFAPAVSAGLLDVRSRQLRCRHPLVRSAIYQAATDAERRAAHRALSEVFSDQPDRRVWHLAAATTTADEMVARELMEAAHRAQQRGGTGLAVSAVERAAELTPDAATRARRLLRAAELAFELGRRETVLRLVDEAAPLPLGVPERTQVTWLREIFDDGLPGSPAGVHSLVDVAEAVADADADLALKLLGGAGLRCWWADLGDDVRRRVVCVAERVPVDVGDPRLLSVLAAAAPLSRAALVLAALRVVPRGTCDPGAARLYGLAAVAAGDPDLAAPFLSIAVDGLRAEGRMGLLAQALVLRAWTGVQHGNVKLATADAEEACRLGHETSQPFLATRSRTAQAVLAGMRGDEAGAEAFAAEAEAASLPTRASALLADVQLSRGITALGGGRPDEAYGHLRRMFDPGDPAHHYAKTPWAIGDLAEAAVLSGQVKEAGAFLAALERSDEARAASPRLQVALAYARPLLADVETAEGLFKAGLCSDLARWPFYRARLLLAYGGWLRRQRQVAESRAPLRTARDAFDALGTVPWANRARQELRAAGEGSDRPPVRAWDQLTPQELQIAEMAAGGLSNREIAQRLYLSHRTVGSHLYKIFPKLGITSRHELRLHFNQSTD